MPPPQLKKLPDENEVTKYYFHSGYLPSGMAELGS